MNSKLQLISFLISFIYGIIFYFLTTLNFKLIDNLKRIVKHIITFIYVLDITIIYILIFYHLNKGYFHIYFILTVFIGFIVGYILDKKLVSKIHVKKIFKNWKTLLIMLISSIEKDGC